MFVCLCHASALAYWLSDLPAKRDFAFIQSLELAGEDPNNYMSYLKEPMSFPIRWPLIQCEPRLSPHQANSLCHELGVWPPLHTIVPRGMRPVHSTNLIEHAHHGAVPVDSYIRAGRRYCVPIPELAILQMMPALNDVEALALCSFFCSVFAFDSRHKSGQRPRRMLTNVSRIEAFVHQCAESDSKAPDGCRRLQKLLPHVVERAASPAEITLGLRMRLPLGKGGYGFGQLLLNHPVPTTRADGRPAERYCDFFKEGKRIGIEYHSDDSHGTKGKWRDDASRGNELLGAGVEEFVLTSRELMNTKSMDASARYIGHRLGVRVFDESAEAFQQREKLRQEIDAALRRFRSSC